METWLVSVLVLLGLPGPLGAGPPAHNSTHSVTDGFFYSEATSELRSTENGAASSSYSSESLSPSQQNLLLTRTAETRAAASAMFNTEQTEVFTETSKGSLEAKNLSTEPLTFSFVITTEASSSSSSRDWKDFTNTKQMPVVAHTLSPEDRSFQSTEEENLPQDSPDTTLRLGGVTDLASQTAVLGERTYTTTISRAGERTLLSVTSSSNNTSSAFTEDSSSRQPSSTWGSPPTPAETEDYTQSAPSTRTNGREQHTYGAFSETGSPVGIRGTPTLTGQPNATTHQRSSTAQETPDSTPPLWVTELSTNQSEVSVSATPPSFTPVNVSGTDDGSGSSVRTSTEATIGAHSSSTQNQEGTEGLSSRTSEGSMRRGLTAAPSTVSSSTSEMNDSSTDVPVVVTEVFLTTEPQNVTDRSQTTEGNTSEATAFTTTVASTLHPLPSTSSTFLSSVSSGYSSQAPTEATIPYTTPTSTVSTLALLTSAAHPTDLASPTQRPFAGTTEPTEATTTHTETSTGTQGVTTAASQYMESTPTHRTPAGSTEAQHTTSKQSEWVEATPPIVIQTARVPPLGNPCVSNPCMNGGVCVSYEGPEYACRCKQAWTGPNCDQDVDECEKDPCPTGSRCVNTRGSFSCECPLGFDLHDGRTCTRAKTFLGTFSFDKHDSSIKSAAMHEIQREIIQLLNVSLSVLRGYSRSTLSKKEQGGLHILAINMFSISADVTTAEVYESVTVFLRKCNSSLSHCRMVLMHQLSYHMESLCEAQRTQCDPERSFCTDSSGTSSCQCLQGYYKHSPDEMSCLECGDGYKLENGTCVPCMFGFGGLNCGNFYKLIAVVVSPAGGALLLILIIVLIVTCCKKDKNDINKIIFKSGDMQMSPYADFPKNSRISMEWGRETIEMQENGSTKNLLQMTDIYYSPALRNSDLERNGLYPFTGLPGSRHSCIYPAQWNPSFTSDDSRRRDYF
ncbi:protein HEG [Nematolebias whitei]|uniref:protein HEG n=1 Tax=Nematolebias whitei TaxID=451745 RepID=UPI0018972954|nr:protein HEG [Nematolebias whitei]